MDRFRISALEKMLTLEDLSMRNRILTLETLIEKMLIYINGARKRNKNGEADHYQQKINKYRTQLHALDSRTVAVC